MNAMLVEECFALQYKTKYPLLIKNIDGKELNTEDSKEYTFLPIFTGSLDFEVRSKHDAHLALTGGEADATPLYEIFLGGWENMKCAIRFNKEKPDKAEAATENCLAGGKYTKFWIKWNYGAIQVKIACYKQPVRDSLYPCSTLQYIF